LTNLHNEGQLSETMRDLRTDAALATLYPEYSRAQLTEWLKKGYITLNGVTPKPKEKVLGNEKVVMHIPQHQPPETAPQAEAIPLDILFEDADLLVLNKPANLVVHPGAGNPNHTLVNALLHHTKAVESLPRAGIIHRLDKDTTGLMVVAKTLTAQTHLVRQMQARTITRQYIALVDGYMIAGGTIHTHYGRHSKNRLKMAVRDDGREAITHYRVKEHLEPFTLVELTLLTGRTHQIRVHMAHIKHPVTCDPLYGKKNPPISNKHPAWDALCIFKRQALHAAHLSFQHPQTHEILTFTAPLPTDFEELLTLLRR